MGYVGVAPLTLVGSHSSVSPNPAQVIDIPAGATAVLLSAHGDAASFTLDGVTEPTSTVGFSVEEDKPAQLVALLTNAVLTVYSASANGQYPFIKM